MPEKSDISVSNIVIETEEDISRDLRHERNRMLKWAPLVMLGNVVLVSVALTLGDKIQEEPREIVAASAIDYIPYNDCASAHLQTDYEAGDVIIPTVSRFNSLCFAFARPIVPSLEES